MCSAYYRSGPSAEMKLMLLRMFSMLPHPKSRVFLTDVAMDKDEELGFRAAALGKLVGADPETWIAKARELMESTLPSSRIVGAQALRGVDSARRALEEQLAAESEPQVRSALLKALLPLRDDPFGEDTQSY